jgi:hypothetical protein
LKKREKKLKRKKESERLQENKKKEKNNSNRKLNKLKQSQQSNHQTKLHGTSGTNGKAKTFQPKMKVLFSIIDNSSWLLQQ